MKSLIITQKITSKGTDSFIQYLKDVSKIPVFTPEEELICAQKASMGDEEAINELVRHNLRFVISVAKQYEQKDNPLEDLVNEGNVGLIMAARRFNPSQGFKFISYAVWYIRKVIREHITQNGRLVRFPSNKVHLLGRLDNKISELEQTLCRTPDIIEIINNFGDEMTPDEQRLLETMSSFHVESLDRGLDEEDSNSSTLGEMLIDDSFGGTDDLLNQKDTTKEIARVLSNLKERDRYVMVKLFGLDGQPAMSLKEVGEEINVTREMVRQIRERCLRLLKDKLKNSSIIYG